jgi:hypothetical protein
MSHCVPTLRRRTAVHVDVDLCLRPVTYVYAVMSVYVRLRGVDTVCLPVGYICLRASTA